MNLLSRILGRNARPQAVRRYDGAAGGRRWSAAPSFGSTGPETLAAAAPNRSRARYFVANNVWASNAVNALVVGLVGAGIKPASAHPDAVTREEIGAAVADTYKRLDADGRTDAFGLQAAAVRAKIVDGEAFVLLEESDAGLRLRLLPAEMVDEADTRNLPGGGYVVAGVEFDAHDRRVAYHVLKSRPTDIFAYAAGSVRVPADNVLHLMHPVGAGQVRGVSWLAPVLLRLSELDGLEDALAVGVKTAAMFSGFLTDMNNTAGGDPFDGEAMPSLEPGTLQRLPGGFDIKFATPQQAQQTAEFVSHQVRAISAGLGVPAHLVSNDLRDANYGSLRAGMIAFKQRLEQIQFQTIIPQMCDPIFGRVVEDLVFSGRISAPDFEESPERYLGAEHYPPAIPWLDPLKDAAATREMLSAGLMSRRQAVAALGYDIESLDAEIAADRKREAKLGLQFTNLKLDEQNKNES